MAIDSGQATPERIASRSDILSLGAHLIAKHISRIREESEDGASKDCPPASTAKSKALEKWLEVCNYVSSNHLFYAVVDKWMMVRTLLSISEGKSALSSLITPDLESRDSFGQILGVFMGSFRSTPDEDVIGSSESY